MDVSNNLLTNESIIYITEQVLHVGTPEARLALQATNRLDEIVNPHHLRILRLKELNLSKNNLKSIEPSMKELEQEERNKPRRLPDGKKQDNGNKDGHRAYKDLSYDQRSKLLLERYQNVSCPMKTFISILYKQLFVENLDLSGNEQLSQYFAQYVFSYLAKQDISNMAVFRFDERAAPANSAQDPHQRLAHLRECGPHDSKVAHVFGFSDSLLANKSLYSHNFQIYSKNLVLLKLNLTGCFIGQSTLDQIDGILEKNLSRR